MPQYDSAKESSMRIENSTLIKFNGTEEEVTVPSGVERISPYAFANCITLKKVIMPIRLKSIGKGAFYGCTSLSEVTMPGRLYLRAKGGNVFPQDVKIFFRFYASSGDRLDDEDYSDVFGSEEDYLANVKNDSEAYLNGGADIKADEPAPEEMPDWTKDVEIPVEEEAPAAEESAAEASGEVIYNVATPIVLESLPPADQAPVPVVIVSDLRDDKTEDLHKNKLKPHTEGKGEGVKEEKPAEAEEKKPEPEKKEEPAPEPEQTSEKQPEPEQKPEKEVVPAEEKTAESETDEAGEKQSSGYVAEDIDPRTLKERMEDIIPPEEEHKLELSGEIINLTDYLVQGDVVLKYIGYAKETVVPDFIHHIGVGAFSNAEVEKVTLPPCIETIEKDAFSWCLSLKEINLPEGLKLIDGGAFASCEALANIEFPSTLKYIGADAFRACGSLKNFTLPAGITSINRRAFDFCENLEEITIPASITTIAEGMFSHCEKLSQITLPDGLKSIGAWAFAECYNLRRINFPEGLEKIGEVAFINCRSIVALRLPESVRMVGRQAFVGCESLHLVNLPAHLEASVKNQKVFHKLPKVRLNFE